MADYKEIRERVFKEDGTGYPAVSFVDGLSIHALSHPPQIVRIADAVVYDDCLGRSRRPVFKRQTGFFLLILCGLRIG